MLVLGKYYVYRHIANGKVFYIGKSTIYEKGCLPFSQRYYSRAYSKANRTIEWYELSKNGFEVEIVTHFDNEDFAHTKEIELISLYKRITDGGTLCNQAIGGNSPKGVSRTIEQCEAISVRMKQNNRFLINGLPANTKKVKNLITNEVYLSIAEAAIKNGYKRQTLNAMLCGINPNTSTLIYL